MGGKWLSHSVINAAQKLLKARHSSIGGLQNTLLAQNMQFQIERENFVQILNISDSHWIMIANVGCVPGEVHVYDNMGHTDVPQEVKQRIAAMILSPTNKITLIFESPHDSNNCGVFTIAFATSICFSAYPSNLLYNQTCLRSYLTKCLESGMMEPFPAKERKAQRPFSHVQYEIFCSCRLMRGDDKMARCDGCHLWYHKTCEIIPSFIFKKTKEWFCRTCVYLS